MHRLQTCRKDADLAYWSLRITNNLQSWQPLHCTGFVADRLCKALGARIRHVLPDGVEQIQCTDCRCKQHPVLVRLSALMQSLL